VSSPSTHGASSSPPRILEAFADGIRPKPQTTFGNVKADVLARYVPGFERGDFVRTILDSSWAE
jgi:hypothetical protein